MIMDTLIQTQGGGRGELEEDEQPEEGYVETTGCDKYRCHYCTQTRSTTYSVMVPNHLLCL